MSDFRTFFGNHGQYLKAADLNGREVTVTIAQIDKGVIDNDKGRDEKPVFFFRELERGLFCNHTNAEAIGVLWGWDPEAVIGKRITLFPTVCQNSSGQRVPCIRIKQQRPPEEKPDGYRAAVGRGSPHRDQASGLREIVNANLHQLSTGRAPKDSRLPRDGGGDDRGDVAEDFEFLDELRRALEGRGIGTPQQAAFMEWACQHVNVQQICDLNQKGRIELLAKIATGRFDRFKGAPTRQQVA